MSVTVEVDVIEHQMWAQGDRRDPLGVWGFRAALTGDGSSGFNRFNISVAGNKRDAFIYTVYGLSMAQVLGISTTSGAKYRLLTNWPNIDPQAGIQGYGHLRIPQFVGDDDFSSPTAGWRDQVGNNQERFILLFTRVGTPLVIIEMELGQNILGNNFIAEGYGYYWDQRVLLAPGGPRHPGSN